MSKVQETTMTVQFRHIMLMVKDVPAAAKFYNEGLDLEITNSPYAELSKTLTPSPSPKGRGEQEFSWFCSPSPLWERGLGGEGDLRSA